MIYWLIRVVLLGYILNWADQMPQEVLRKGLIHLYIYLYLLQGLMLFEDSSHVTEKSDIGIQRFSL